MCDVTFEYKSKLERHLKSARHASLAGFIMADVQDDATVAEVSQIQGDATERHPATCDPVMEVGAVDLEVYSWSCSM